MIRDFIKGANPYMPLWEHVPDGEPRVFTHDGETRVYVYGSHDTERTEYCGRDYVVWSAPVDDLTDWRCDGICFTADSILYAPDVVKKGDTYYMYAALNKGESIYVAQSKSPIGPFVNPRKTDFGFDVGVLVDDDGRCYAYWGFLKCYCAEINDDMATIKNGTFKSNMIPHCDFRTNHWDSANIDTEFCYFEAASIRKVFGKYVFIYSKRIKNGDRERAIAPNTNCYLDYAYSDSPLGGWVHGGTISNCAGAVITNPDGTKKRAYQTCNNHGSIAEINGKWYIFYHRGTGTNGYARQAMLEPIDIAEQDGKLYIGNIEYDSDGMVVNCTEAEMTSQGAHVNGLDARRIVSAGHACYIDSPDLRDRAYIKPVYDTNNPSAPIVNIKSGTVVGFKYFNFGMSAPIKVYLRLKPIKCGTVRVYFDAPSGEPLCEAVTRGGSDYIILEADLKRSAAGKHAVYIEFGSECEFDWLTFD